MLLSPIAQAKGPGPDCHQIRDPVPFSYCIAPGTDTVLYQFHGRGQSEQTWFGQHTYARLLREALDQNPRMRPTVITVSFGSLALMVPQSDSPRSGLLEHFIEQLLPEMEDALGFVPKHRLLLGESLGGFNALQVALFHGPLFAKLALLCPAVSTTSPHAPLREVFDYIQRTGANPIRAMSAFAHARAYIPDHATWQQISPFALMDRVQALHFPKIYLSAASQDGFGFFEGAQILASTAEKQNLDLTWHPLFGEHCSVDIASLSQFLSQPIP
jgi:pimeloyl-ACP methyl ester carboxylesterase